MKKFQTVDDSERQAKKRALRNSRLILLSMCLLVTPLIYEWGMLTHSRWQGVLGTGYRVETPIMDTIAKLSSEFRYQFGGMSTSAFRKIEWKPGQIVPLAFGFAAVGAWFLRRGI